MTRILFEVNGKKYYRDSCYIYYDMYIKDKNKHLPFMGNNYKLNYDDDNRDFDDIYSYYWNENWCWVKDEYIELPDEELCSCNDDIIVTRDNKYTRCYNCKKVILFISN